MIRLFLAYFLSAGALLPSLSGAVCALLLPALAGSMQERADASMLTFLNRELLEVHQLWSKAAPEDRRRLQETASALVRRRAAALSGLIEKNPKDALGLVLNEDLLEKVAAAFPETKAELESHGSWEGPIEYLVVDDFAAGKSSSRIRMRLARDWIEVFFAGPETAGLISGVVLRVRGVRVGNRILATDGAVR